MSARSLALVLAFASLTGSGVGARAIATQAPSLRERLEAARAIPGDLERAQAEADVWFSARDFPRVLEAVDRGLTAEPSDPLLLWRAAAASLWLQDGPGAAKWSTRLAEAADALEPSEGAGWLEAAERFQGDAQRFVDLDAERDAALSRSRIVVGGGLALAVLAMLLAGRPRHGAGA